jgi:hypothetical protein
VVRTRNAALDFDRQLDEGLRAARSEGSSLGAAVIGRPLTGAMQPRLRCLLPPPSLSAYAHRGWGQARGWFDTHLLTPSVCGVRMCGCVVAAVDERVAAEMARMRVAIVGDVDH